MNCQLSAIGHPDRLSPTFVFMEITIREFRPGDEAAFRRLNEEWIDRHFAMEAADMHALEHPKEKVLDPGGRIYFACCDGEPVACCALIAMAPGEFEVAKMAVTESFQGKGIGRRVLAHVIAEADAAGVKRLYLETNSKLVPAVRLYESLGFRHLRPEEVRPSPYARAEVFMERRV